MRKQHPLAQAGYIFAWLVLTLVATATAWQLHVTVLYLATLLVESPTWRPTGWSTGTVASVSRLSILGVGSLWLIFVTFLEYQLREALQEERLIRQSTRFAVGLLIIFGVCCVFTG